MSPGTWGHRLRRSVPTADMSFGAGTRADGAPADGMAAGNGCFEASSRLPPGLLQASSRLPPGFLQASFRLPSGSLRGLRVLRERKEPALPVRGGWVHPHEFLKRPFWGSCSFLGSAGTRVGERSRGGRPSGSRSSRRARRTRRRPGGSRRPRRSRRQAGSSRPIAVAPECRRNARPCAVAASRCAASTSVPPCHPGHPGRPWPPCETPRPAIGVPTAGRGSLASARVARLRRRSRRRRGRRPGSRAGARRLPRRASGTPCVPR